MLHYNSMHPLDPITSEKISDLMHLFERAGLVTRRTSSIGNVSITQYKMTKEFGRRALDIVKPFVAGLYRVVAADLSLEPMRRSK
ncbi:MAG: hypothetical protein KGI04_03355 [Candidatus Micrarchaeota archaeon]|nr:hypothetical protein [Candidatus Micrarchaeota archaeon]